MATGIRLPFDEAVQAESMVEAVAALSRGTGAVVRLLTLFRAGRERTA